MSYYQKVKKSHSHNTHRLSSIKGRNLGTRNSGGISGVNRLSPPSSSSQPIVYVNPSPDFSIRELTDEQHRVMEQMKTVTRRVDNIETNMDQTQFQALQRQLSSYHALTPPSESLEDFEREYNQKLADMHEELQGLHMQLLQTKEDGDNNTGENREVSRGLLGPWKTPDSEDAGKGATPTGAVSLQHDLEALKSEWQSELQSNLQELKTDMQSQYQRDLQLIQSLWDGSSHPNVQQDLQSVKAQIQSQSQTLAGVTLQSKTVLDEITTQLNQLRLNAEAVAEMQKLGQSGITNVERSFSDIVTKVNSLEGLRDQITQLKHDMDLSISQSNQDLQSREAQWKTDLAFQLQQVETKLASSVAQTQSSVAQTQSSVAELKVTIMGMETAGSSWKDTAFSTLGDQLKEVTTKLNALAEWQTKVELDDGIKSKIVYLEASMDQNKQDVLAMISQLNVQQNIQSSNDHDSDPSLTVHPQTTDRSLFDMFNPWADKLQQFQAQQEQQFKSLQAEVQASALQSIQIQVEELKSSLQNSVQFKVDEVKANLEGTVQAKVDEVKANLEGTVQAKVDEMKEIVNTQTNELTDTLNATKESLQFQVDELSSNMKHDNRLNEVENIQKDIATKQSLMDSIQAQLSELIQTLAKLKDDVVYKDQIEVADTVTDEFDDKLNQIKAMVQIEMDSKIQQTLTTLQGMIDQRMVGSEDVLRRVVGSEDILRKVVGSNVTLEKKISQEVLQYRQQIQTLNSYLQEFQLKNMDELKTMKEQYNSSVLNTRDQVQSHIDDCQKEIQTVEGRLVSILAELEIVHQENKTVNLSVQARTEEAMAAVSDLKEGHSSLFAQIPPIRQEIMDIEKRIDAIKSEFTVQTQHTEEKFSTIEETSKQASQKTLEMSETCKLLDNQFQFISGNFKSQYETLQKRYQELHTISVSNMEETERGNQGVRELIELHTRIEQEYKDMTNSYEQQQKEYKMSLSQRDDRLQLLEDQVKSQLDNVDYRLTCLQDQSGDNSNGKSTLSARIEELSQPRHITPKKIT